MLKFYKTFAVTLFLPVLCLAQRNFKPGYILTLKGDTLKGFIDYRNWGPNPSTISFAQTQGSQAQSYNTQNANGFGVNGLENYIRFNNLHISNGRISTSDLSPTIDTSWHTATVFLKALVTGDAVSLYSYTDDVKTRYYIAQGEQQPQELAYQVYYGNTDDGVGGIKRNYRYRIQLSSFASELSKNSAALSNRIETAEYEESDLIKIVSLLNNKVNKTNASAKKAEGALYVGAGASYNTLSFKGSAAFANSSNVTNTPMPYVALGYCFLVNKLANSLFFDVSAELSADSHRVTATEPTSSSTVIGYIAIKFKSIAERITPLIGYRFYYSPKFSITAGAGAMLTVSQNGDYNFVETFDNGLPALIRNKFPAYSTFWVSPVVRAGIELNNKLAINAAFALPKEVVTYNGSSGSVNTVQLGAAWHFCKH